MDFQLFDDPIDENKDVIRKYYIEYRPVSAPTPGAPLEFFVPAHGPHPISLKDCTLALQWTVVKNGHEKITPLEKVAPINLAHHTMWRQVDLSLHHSVLHSPGLLYAYRAYIEKLLGYNKHEKDSILNTEFWYTDDPGNFQLARTYGSREKDLKDFEKMTPEQKALNPYGDTINKGFADRNEAIITKLFGVDTEGPIHLDMFQQDKPLLPGVDIGLKFWPNSSDFTIMQARKNLNNYNVIIKNACLKICYIEMKDTALNSIESRLIKKPATYPITKTVLKQYFISHNTASFSIDDIYQGDVPSILIIGLIKAVSFAGNKNDNPLRFCNYNLKSIGFYVNGESVPSKPINVCFESQKGELKTEGYRSILSVLPEGSCPFDIADWEHDNNLYGFNIAGKKESSIRKGHTRLEIIGNGSGDGQVLLTYAIFPGVVNITKDRRVIQD